MLLNVKVVNVDTVKGGTREDSGGVRCPHGIDNDHAHVEEHHLGLGIGRVPNSDGPVSRGRDESGRVVVVPPHLVHCQQVAFVSLLILARVGKGALVDLSFLRAYQEAEVVESVEIEAQSTGKTNKRSFFFLLTGELQLEHFLRLEFVLHEAPVHDPAVGRN